MAVVIRMKRTGRRRRPSYRISVAESEKPRDGRTLDTLGVYDPLGVRPELQVTLDVERARHWLDQGALPSDTVRSIFRRNGVYEGRPVAEKRKRTGRYRDTATKRSRAERKARLDERKPTRNKSAATG